MLMVGLFFSAPSSAQSILLLDIEAVITNAAAYTSMIAQVEAERQIQQAFFGQAEEELREESQRLVDQREEISAQEFEVYRQSFDEKVRNLQERARDIQATIRDAQAQALAQIRADALMIAQRIGEARGAQVILEQNTTLVIIDQAADITADVAAQLDDVRPEVKLTFDGASE
ncbi:MAG: OmpH family outer membrane protein [Pseudomonadota bacterium]